MKNHFKGHIIFQIKNIKENKAIQELIKIYKLSKKKMKSMFYANPFIYDFFTHKFFRFYQKIIQKLEKFIDFTQPLNILDIACGPGRLLIELKKKYPHLNLIGIDIDKKMIDYAQKQALKNHLNIKFYLVNAQYLDKLNLANESFDLILSTFAFHHFSPSVKMKVLENVKNLLKKDAIFVVVDFGENKNKLVKFFISLVSFLDGENYLRNHLNGEMERILRETNFYFEKENNRSLISFFLIKLKDE